MATTPLSKAFITLSEIINNFLISYTGVGRLIPDVERTEVIFHARRCLQEFSYETIKSQFIEERTAAGTGAVVANTAYSLPADFVAVISAINSGFSTTSKLTEVSVLVNPLGTGNFFINYVAKTITYGNSGDATLTYLSNALTTDESAAIPKLAEQALYSCIVYSILANKENTRPDILQRLLVEKNDNLERAKSRLVFTNFD